MTPTLPSAPDDPASLKVLYDRAAQDYFDSLPLEHFMEAMPHAAQRKITLDSFDFIHARRADIQCFSELLVQYPRPGQDPGRPGQVVPDNMVVVHREQIEGLRSYNTVLQPGPPILVLEYGWYCLDHTGCQDLQPGPPILVLEYVSKKSKQKDYEDNLQKYEQELKVPYYLLFDLDAHKLHLYQMSDDGYQEVEPNENGRFAIHELELEAALHHGWVRYWFRGDLVPLFSEFLHNLDAERLAHQAQQQILEAENARLREELAKWKKE